jgi:ribosomal protein S11
MVSSKLFNRFVKHAVKWRAKIRKALLAQRAGLKASDVGSGWPSDRKLVEVLKSKGSKERFFRWKVGLAARSVAVNPLQGGALVESIGGFVRGNLQAASREDAVGLRAVVKPNRYAVVERANNLSTVSVGQDKLMEPGNGLNLLNKVSRARVVRLARLTNRLSLSRVSSLNSLDGLKAASFEPIKIRSVVKLKPVVKAAQKPKQVIKYDRVALQKKIASVKRRFGFIPRKQNFYTVTRRPAYKRGAEQLFAFSRKRLIRRGRPTAVRSVKTGKAVLKRRAAGRSSYYIRTRNKTYIRNKRKSKFYGKRRWKRKKDRLVRRWGFRRRRKPYLRSPHTHFSLVLGVKKRKHIFLKKHWFYYLNDIFPALKSRRGVVVTERKKLEKLLRSGSRRKRYKAIFKRLIPYVRKSKLARQLRIKSGLGLALRFAAIRDSLLVNGPIGRYAKTKGVPYIQVHQRYARYRKWVRHLLFLGSRGGRYYRPKGFFIHPRIKHMLREKLEMCKFRLRTGATRVPDLRYNRGKYRRRKYMARRYRRLMKRYRLRPKTFFYARRRARNRGFSKSVRLPVVPTINFKQTSNNFFVHVQDTAGHTLFSASAGNVGFGGPKRRTPYAAEMLGKAIGNKLLARNYSTVALRFRTRPSISLKSAVKGVLGSLVQVGKTSSSKSRKGRKQFTKKLKVAMASLLVPRSHNGLRPKKARRM